MENTIKKEIKFNSSMNVDKRNEDFAYLRLNCANVGTRGLYGGKDFSDDGVDFTTDETIVDIIGYTYDDPFIITEDGSTINVYDGISNTPIDSGSYFVDAMADGNDGVHFVDESSRKVYRIRKGVAGIIADAGAFPSFPAVDIGTFDGLYYWWIGGKIWRQLEDDNPELIMSSSGIDSPRFAVPYRDYIVIFSQKTSSQDSQSYWQPIEVFFHDKKNTTLFSKRIQASGSTLLGAGVIKDRLFMIYNRPTYLNVNELASEIVVSAFDGEKFVEMNTILGGRERLSIPNSYLAGTTCRWNDEFIIFSVDNNDRNYIRHQDLTKNYLYRVYYDGRIEALAEPFLTNSRNYASVVQINSDGIYYGLDTQSSTPTKVLMNNSNQTSDINNFFEFSSTKYITNFYCNPYNTHHLDGISFTFEKILDNSSASYPDPELNIFYRISDRDNWTLLSNITYQDIINNVDKRITMTPSTTVPLPEQRYQIVKQQDFEIITASTEATGDTIIPNYSNTDWTPTVGERILVHSAGSSGLKDYTSYWIKTVSSPTNAFTVATTPNATSKIELSNSSITFSPAGDTKFSDALPDFNEIQFKFEPKYGFTIIQAWFKYHYLTRNTLE